MITALNKSQYPVFTKKKKEYECKYPNTIYYTNITDIDVERCADTVDRIIIKKKRKETQP